MRKAKAMYRIVYPEWMDFVAAIASNGIDKESAKKKIEKFLVSCNVGSKETRRKSVNILINLFFEQNNELNLKEKPKDFFLLEGKDRNKLYIEMFRQYYSFFNDAYEILIRLEKVNGKIITTDYYLRIIEKWGDTSTIKRMARTVKRTYNLFNGD